MFIFIVHFSFRMSLLAQNDCRYCAPHLISFFRASTQRILQAVTRLFHKFVLRYCIQIFLIQFLHRTRVMIIDRYEIFWSCLARMLLLSAVDAACVNPKVASVLDADLRSKCFLSHDFAKFHAIKISTIIF